MNITDTRRGRTPAARFTMGELGVMLFTAAYLLPAAVATVTRGNDEFLLYVLVMAALIGGIWTVHRRVRLSVGLLWCLTLWGLLHMAGGLLAIPADWPHNAGDAPPVLYNLWFVSGALKYDQVVHAYGFAVTTWLCWQALRAAMAAQAGRPREAVVPTFGLMLLCAAGGMGFGALNEVVEFIATLTLPQTNVGGYVNTGWDLVANAVGATLAAVLIGVLAPARRG